MESSKKSLIKIQNKNSTYYVISPPIGKGAYGQVFIGLDESNHKYAVKHFENSKLQRDKLLRELAMYYHLKCDNIIRIKDVVCTNNSTYVLLELCDCENLMELQTFYKKAFSHPPTLRLTQIIFKQIAAGLRYMAKNNCIHRDIKLDNIMISQTKSFNESVELTSTRLNDLTVNNLENKGKSMIIDSAMIDFEKKKPEYHNSLYTESEEVFEKEISKYTVKIIDLGFAKKIEEGNLAQTLCGTPMNIAPEIWEIGGGEGESYSGKVDVFSYGTTLYYFVFSQFLFKANSQAALVSMIKKGDYDLPLNVHKLTYEFIDFVSGITAFKPEERFDWDKVCSHPFLEVPLDQQEQYNGKEKDFLKLSIVYPKRWIKDGGKMNTANLPDTKIVPSKETEIAWEEIKLNLTGKRKGVEIIRIRDSGIHGFELVE